MSPTVGIPLKSHKTCLYQMKPENNAWSSFVKKAVYNLKEKPT